MKDKASNIADIFNLTIENFIKKLETLNPYQKDYDVIEDNDMYKLLYRLTNRFSKDKVMEFFTYLPIHDICNPELDKKILDEENEKYPLYCRIWKIIKGGDRKTYNPAKLSLTQEDIYNLYTWGEYLKSMLLYNGKEILQTDTQKVDEGYKLASKTMKEYGDFLIEAEMLHFKPLIMIRDMYLDAKKLHQLISNNKKKDKVYETFKTEKVQKAIEKAKLGGYIEEIDNGYKWLDTKVKLTYFVAKIFQKEGQNIKYVSIPYKRIGELFEINGEKVGDLHSNKYQMDNYTDEQEWRPDIDKLFE